MDISGADATLWRQQDYDPLEENEVHLLGACAGEYGVSVCLVLFSVTSHWAPVLASFTKFGERARKSSITVFPISNDNYAAATHDSAHPHESSNKKRRGAVDAVATAAFSAVELATMPSTTTMPNTREVLDREYCSDDDCNDTPADVAQIADLRSMMPIFVSNINASGYIAPPVAVEELLSTLRAPSHSILNQGRKLLVIAAFLAYTEIGRETLVTVLQQEFCAENVVFLVAAATLRANIAANAAALPIESVTQLVHSHLDRGAEMEVNTSADNVASVTQACSHMMMAATSETIAAAAERLAAALSSIERDVFGTVMRGPVFRFVQKPQYRIWADNTATLFRVESR